jgi:hypothetical protein
VSEEGKALLESEPGSIPPAREASGNRGIPNAPAAASDFVLGEGGHRRLTAKAKAFYGPSYGIIQIIQNIQDIQGFQGFRFFQKIYTSKKNTLFVCRFCKLFLPFLLE